MCDRKPTWLNANLANTYLRFVSWLFDRQTPLSYFYNDVTCTVVLKHAFSSCKNFDGTRGMDLRRAHSPIGQALLCALDSKQYLARRGKQVKSLPAIVLAGRKTPPEGAERLCCMHVGILVGGGT
jgi:hypothetical protein